MPTIAVRYPFSRNIFGRVIMEVSMSIGAVPGRIFASRFRHGYTPVSSAYLLGVQVAEVAYPLVKRIPPAARLSMEGVSIPVPP